MNTTHFIIRVEDGVNFKNSKKPIWGVNARFYRIVNQMKKGDIIWFVTNKTNDNLLVGMAEFVEMYDRRDEKLVAFNTFTNEEMGWHGDTDWCIQIHYKNLYLTEYHKIHIPIKGQTAIRYYKNCADKIDENLYEHFIGFKKYAIPIFT